jgi:hypothetical protein
MAIALITCWSLMTALGAISIGFIDGCDFNIAMGDPRRIRNGIDYHGDVCGVDNSKHQLYCGQKNNTHVGRDLTQQPFSYHPIPTEQTFIICVERCPGATANAGSNSYVIPSDGSLITPPSNKTWHGGGMKNYQDAICKYGNYSNLNQSNIEQGGQSEGSGRFIRISELK